MAQSGETDLCIIMKGMTHWPETGTELGGGNNPTLAP